MMKGLHFDETIQQQQLYFANFCFKLREKKAGCSDMFSGALHRIYLIISNAVLTEVPFPPAISVYPVFCLINCRQIMNYA